MFDQKIYDKWGLHKDATQLEINYKYFTKVIDTLNCQLLHCTNDEILSSKYEIKDQDLITKWKINTVDQLNNEYQTISYSLFFAENKYLNHNNPIIKGLFRIIQALNDLKIINYKSQDIDLYYLPLIFRLANKFLNVDEFADWICFLTEIIINNKYEIDSKITLNFNIAISENLNNTVWYLDNLGLWFNDIYNWYNSKRKLQPDDEEYQKLIGQITNYLLVYVLSDFYVKNIFDLNDKLRLDFHTLYQSVLCAIRQLIQQQKFAIVGLKAIAIFLNELLLTKLINQNDCLLYRYKLILDVCCSSKNKEKLLNIVFNNLK